MTDKQVERSSNSTTSQVLIGIVIGIIILIIEYTIFQHHEPTKEVIRGETIIERVVIWTIFAIWNLPAIPSLLVCMCFVGFFYVIIVIGSIVAPILQAGEIYGSVKKGVRPPFIYGEMFSNSAITGFFDDFFSYFKVFVFSGIIWLLFTLIVYSASQLGFYPAQRAILITEHYIDKGYFYLLNNKNAREMPQTLLKFSFVYLFEMIFFYIVVRIIANRYKK